MFAAATDHTMGSGPMSVFQSRDLAYNHEQKTYNYAFLNIAGNSFSLLANAVFHQFPWTTGIAVAATFAQQYASVSSRAVRYIGSSETETRNNLATTGLMIKANGAAAAVQMGAQATVLMSVVPQTVRNFEANHKSGMAVTGVFTALALAATAVSVRNLWRCHTDLKTVRQIQKNLPQAPARN